MLKEVRLSFQHPGCWLQETTERYPTVTLVISSVYQVDDDIHIDLFAHAPDPKTLEDAWSDWKKDGRIRKISKLYEGPRGIRFHVAYTAKHSIYPHIIHHTPISLGAISMAVGVEYYLIVGESEDIQDLLKVLGKEGTPRVLSIKDLAEVPEAPGRPLASDLFSQLTDKQVEAMVLAHEEGYYTWPRISSASDLAAKLGLSIPAFLDHLRRAESKTLHAIVKDLQETDPARFEAARARLKERAKAAAKKAAAKPMGETNAV